MTAFVHCMCRAGAFARSSRQTMSKALMYRYITTGQHMFSSKMPLPVEDLDPT